jgi:hypothetical protein
MHNNNRTANFSPQKIKTPTVCGAALPHRIAAAGESKVNEMHRINEWRDVIGGLRRF